MKIERFYLTSYSLFGVNFDTNNDTDDTITDFVIQGDALDNKGHKRHIELIIYQETMIKIAQTVVNRQRGTNE